MIHWASVAHHELSIRPAENRRRRCHHRGHKGKKPAATHVGYAKDMAMTTGCERHVRQWLRETKKRGVVAWGTWSGKGGWKFK